MRFKVYKDFNNFILIDEDELEKALYAFQTGSGVMFDMGAMSHIESIMPDYNSACGWYSDYKPNQDDNAELDNIKPLFSKLISKTKERIQYLIETKQENLIGKNVEIPELSRTKNPQLNEATKELSDKMKIK